MRAMTTSPRPTGPPPVRELRDPRELKALAHPVRLRLLEELAALGQATATDLGARVGESPANCSYHLRQLARYGYIEEVGEGAGRRRPWRWVPQVTNITADDRDPAELRHARDAAVAVLRERDLESWRRWQSSRQDAPGAWREASFDASGINWLTPDELAEVGQQIRAVLDRYLLARQERVDPDARPDGARLVHLSAWGFPAGSVADLADDGPDHAGGDDTAAADAGPDGGRR
jgi:DNA-binding transcriptional ArsR family regulator